MANKYGSREIEFEVPALVTSVATITSGTPLVFSQPAINYGFPTFLEENALLDNVNSRISAVGIFSNFADGLVFREAVNFMSVFVRYVYLSGPTALAGTVTMGRGTNTLTGVGTTFTGLSPGDILKINTSEFYTIRSITNDTSLVTVEPARFDFSGDSYSSFLPDSFSDFEFAISKNLNNLQTVDRFISVVDDISALEPDFIGVQLGIKIGGSSNSNSINFYTDSIDSAYNGESAYLSARAVIEL